MTDTLHADLEPHALLARELLHAERRKATVLAALLVVLAVVLAAAFVGFGASIERIARHPAARFAVPPVLLAAAAHQLYMRRLLERAVERGDQPPRWLGYAGAVVEVSVPTAGSLAAMYVLSPVDALGGPQMFAYAIFIVLGALRLDAGACLLAGIVAASEYMLLCAMVAPWADPSLSGTSGAAAELYALRALMLLLTGVATALVARELRRRIVQTLEETRRRRHVHGVLGRYLTKQVADVLVHDEQALELGGESRRVTLLMSDLRGFSSLAEAHSPQDVIAMLNHYLGTMTEVIEQYSGTIDEFIGDAILVIFGAPQTDEQQADHAVACAIAMQNAMAAVNEHNEAGALPPLAMGIGIHTGEVVVGNIGSVKRSKYGVVGSAVNLTARVESYTGGGQILITQATRAAVHAPLTIAGERDVTPKGSSRPVTLCDLIGIGPPVDLTLRAKRVRSAREEQP